VWFFIHLLNINKSL
jgi:large subunit ribosomal protein L4e